MIVPPASLTIISPAAMSQAWIPISKYKSIAPLATWAKFQAAEPAARILENKVIFLKIVHGKMRHF